MSELLKIENQLSGIFPSLTLKQIELITEETRPTFGKKGELIIEEGNDCTGFLFIINGKVALKKQVNKKKQTLVFLNQGEGFFANESFVGSVFGCSCECLDTTYYTTIPKDIIRNIFVENQSFMIEFMARGGKEADLIDQKAADLVTLPIKHRFLDSLRTLLEKFGEKRRDHIFIPVKRDEIGKYINASKASLSRVIAELEEKNIITASRSGIIVPNQALLLEEIGTE